MSSPTYTKAYKGCCHCGKTQYLIRLTLPPNIEDPRQPGSVRIYKCNCSTCLKMGYFHCRPVDPGRDFVLLKPLIGFESSAGMGGEKADKEGEGNDEKEEGLANYQCFSKQISWYFCKTCGVRCFAYGGPDDGVVQDLDLETWSLQEQTYPSQDTASTDTANTQDQTKNTKTRVWHPLTGTWTTPEGRTKQSVYLSVNATTIEPDQPGFDLKEWHEKGWIVYGDWKNFNKEGGAEVGRRFGTPWNSGCY